MSEIKKSYVIPHERVRSDPPYQSILPTLKSLFEGCQLSKIKFLLLLSATTFSTSLQLKSVPAQDKTL